MAPSKKHSSTGKNKCKSATDSHKDGTNTKNSGTPEDSLYDNGKRNLASNANTNSDPSDNSSDNIESEVSDSDSESEHDIYGDLGNDVDEETESDSNPLQKLFELPSQKNDYKIEEKNNNPVTAKPAVASKILEDQINTKQKDIQSDLKIKQNSLKKRKSNKVKDKSSVQTNLDLFDDIIISRKNEVSSKEVLELKQELENAREDFRKSQEYSSKLEEDNEQLLKNTSALWKTAMLQIRGKVAEIVKLKREKEAIIFRRAMKQVAKDELDRVVGHIAAYNKEEFAEFMEGMKSEGNCNCGGTGAQKRYPGQNNVTSLKKEIQDKVLGTRVSANDNRDALMLQKHLGKAGQKISKHPTLLHKKTHHAIDNRKNINKKKVEENEQDVPAQDIAKKRSIKTGVIGLTKESSDDRLDRYEEAGKRRQGEYNYRSNYESGDERYNSRRTKDFKEDRKRYESDGDIITNSIRNGESDDERHNTRTKSNTRDRARTNDLHYESRDSGDERYDSRRTRNKDSKEDRKTNESDADIFNDRCMRNRNSRIDLQRDESNDEKSISRRSTRSRDQSDLKNRSDKKEKIESIDEVKRTKNKRKRSESPGLDTKVKRESRRNNPKNIEQRESNTRMSVFERLGRSKNQNIKKDDTSLENETNENRTEMSDDITKKHLSDSKDIFSDDIHKRGESLNEESHSKTKNRTNENQNVRDLNIDINFSISRDNDCEQKDENVHYEIERDYKTSNSHPGVAKSTDKLNENSINIYTKQDHLHSLNQGNTIPDTLFAQRMKERLGMTSKTREMPTKPVSSQKAIHNQYENESDYENIDSPTDVAEGKDKLIENSNKVYKEQHHSVSLNERNTIPDTLFAQRMKERLGMTDKNRKMLKNQIPSQIIQETKLKDTLSTKNVKEVYLPDILKKLLPSSSQSCDVQSDDVNSNHNIKFNEPNIKKSEEKVDNNSFALKEINSNMKNNPTNIKNDVGSILNTSVEIQHQKTVDSSEKLSKGKEVVKGCLKDLLSSLKKSDNKLSQGPKTVLESKRSMVVDDETVEGCEQKTLSVGKNILDTELPVSLQLSNKPKFDSLEDILSGMGLEVSPKHNDALSGEIKSLEVDKDTEINLPVEDNISSVLTSSMEDKFENSISMSQSEEKCRNNSDKQPRRSKRKSKEGVKNEDENIKKSESTVKNSESTIKKSESTVNKSESTVKDSESIANKCESAVKAPKSTVKKCESTVKASKSTVMKSESTTKRPENTAMKSESTVDKHLNDTSCNVIKQTEHLMDHEKKSKCIVDDLENSAITSQKSAKVIENKIESDSSSDEEIIRSKVRKSITQRSKIRRLRIESDSSTDEDIQKIISKSPLNEKSKKSPKARTSPRKKEIDQGRELNRRDDRKRDATTINSRERSSRSGKESTSDLKSESLKYKKNSDRKGPIHSSGDEKRSKENIRRRTRHSSGNEKRSKEDKRRTRNHKDMEKDRNERMTEKRGITYERKVEKQLKKDIIDGKYKTEEKPISQGSETKSVDNVIINKAHVNPECIKKMTEERINDIEEGELDEGEIRESFNEKVTEEPINDDENDDYVNKRNRKSSEVDNKKDAILRDVICKDKENKCKENLHKDEKYEINKKENIISSKEDKPQDVNVVGKEEPFGEQSLRRITPIHIVDKKEPEFIIGVTSASPRKSKHGQISIQENSQQLHEQNSREPVAKDFVESKSTIDQSQRPTRRIKPIPVESETDPSTLFRVTTSDAPIEGYSTKCMSSNELTDLTNVDDSEAKTRREKQIPLKICDDSEMSLLQYIGKDQPETSEIQNVDEADTSQSIQEKIYAENTNHKVHTTQDFSETETSSQNKSQTNNSFSDRSPISDGNKDSLTVNSGLPQHFRKRVKKKRSNAVFTAVSSTVVNCSPIKNDIENVSTTNVSVKSEIHIIKSLDKDLEVKDKIETKSILDEKVNNKQIPVDKNNIAKEVEKTTKSKNAIERASVELHDTMNILRNIVAKKQSKEDDLNLETNIRSENISILSFESQINNDTDSNVDDLFKDEENQTNIKNKLDSHTKKDNLSDKDNHKKERMSKKISLLFDEDSQESRKSSSGEESKKISYLNSDKKKECPKDNEKIRNEKVAKKISSLFDGEIQSSTESDTSETNLTYSSTEERQNKKSISKGAASNSKSNIKNNSLSGSEDRRNKVCMSNSSSSSKSKNKNSHVSESKEIQEVHKDLTVEVSVREKTDAPVKMLSEGMNNGAIGTTEINNQNEKDPYNSKITEKENEVLKESVEDKNKSSKEPEFKESECEEPVYNEDFLEIFATESFAEDMDLDVSPVKKQNNKSYKTTEIKTNVDKWQQSFSGRVETESKKRNDKKSTLIKEVGDKSAFGIEERKKKEWEIDSTNEINMKVEDKLKEKSKHAEDCKVVKNTNIKTDINEIEASNEKKISKNRSIKSQKSNDNVICRRSPRKLQTPVKKDNRDDWFPSEEELLFEESDSSDQNDDIQITDASRNLFDVESKNVKNEEIEKLKNRSNTVKSSVERNQKSLSKNISESNYTRTSSKHKEGPLAALERKCRTSPSRERRSDRKLRSPIRSPEKHPYQRVLTSPRQSRTSPKSKTSPRSKHLRESKTSPKARTSPRRKEVDYRERDRREGRKQDETTINSRERSTRSRKESTHDEISADHSRERERDRRDDRKKDALSINSRDRSTRNRRESTHDEISEDLSRERERDRREDRKHDAPSIHSRERSTRSTKESTHDDISEDLKCKRNSDRRRTKQSSGDEKRSKEDNQRRTRHSSGDEKRSKDDTQRRTRHSSGEEKRTKEDNRRTRNYKERQTDRNERITEKREISKEKKVFKQDIISEECKTDENLTISQVSETKSVDNVIINKAHVNPELIKKFTEGRSSDIEDGELDEEEEGEIRESPNEKVIKETLNEVQKDVSVNKGNRESNEVDSKKDAVLIDAKYNDKKYKNENKIKDDLYKEKKYEKDIKKNIVTKEDKQQDFHSSKDVNFVKKYAKPVSFVKKYENLPKRSERSYRRITPVRIVNKSEPESSHRVRRSTSPGKYEFGRRSVHENSQQLQEQNPRKRVITDRLSTPTIDRSQRPSRRIKPIPVEPEPDLSNLFRVKKIDKPQECYFTQFMSSIGFKNLTNFDENNENDNSDKSMDYLGRTITVEHQMQHSKTDDCGTKTRSEKKVPLNDCDDSEMSLLKYITKDQQETNKSLETQVVDETDTCESIQEKIFAENTITTVNNYKLEEIEKYICKDNSNKSPLDQVKLHPLDPRLKLLSNKEKSEEVKDQEVKDQEVVSPLLNEMKNVAIHEEDTCNSLDLIKQLELSSDVTTNQDSNSIGPMDVSNMSRNISKVMNAEAQSSKETSEAAAEDKQDDSDSEDSSSSDDSTTEDSSSCPAAPSSSSRSSHFPSSASRSSHINSLSKSPKPVDTPSSVTKRLNFESFKIPKSVNDENSILPDVVFPLKPENNPVVVQFGKQLLTSNNKTTDASSHSEEIEETPAECVNKSIENGKVETIAKISQPGSSDVAKIHKDNEEIAKEDARQISPNKEVATEDHSNLEVDKVKKDDHICNEASIQEDLATEQDKSEIDEETMVMEDLHLESDSDSDSNVSGSLGSSSSNSSSNSSSSSSSGSDSDTSKDSEGEKDEHGAGKSHQTNLIASSPSKSPRSLRRSPRKSPKKSTIEYKSVTKSPFKSPIKSAYKSPCKSTTKSFKSPIKSPSKKQFSPPKTPRTPKSAVTPKSPEASISPSMPCLFDSTPKKTPKKHKLSYKKSPSPHKKLHKTKTPKKTVETLKMHIKMTEDISEETTSKSPSNKLMANRKSPRKTPHNTPDTVLSPEKSPCKVSSPKTPGKSPCKTLKSPCKKLLPKSPHKSNRTPCKFKSPDKSPWKTSSPRTPGKDLMTSMMSPPMSLNMSPGKTVSHLWKSPKKTIRKNEPLLLNDQMNFMPFQSPPAGNMDLIDQNYIDNSPVLKKDENIVVREDELRMLLELERLANEAESNENENSPNNSLSVTSGEEEESVLSALALSPEETPARPNASNLDDITPKRGNEATPRNFRKKSQTEEDNTPNVCDMISTPKTNVGADAIERQATSTPKVPTVESPGRNKLLQQEILMTPITSDSNTTPNERHNETPVNSKTFTDALQETPKSSKIRQKFEETENSISKLTADNLKKLSSECIGQEKGNDTTKNKSIDGVLALHTDSESNKVKQINNGSCGSKETSPVSPRKMRSYITSTGQLRVRKRKSNFSLSNDLPALSCSQSLTTSVSVVHTDEKTLINTSSHKKQLFPSHENGSKKRTVSPSVSQKSEAENVPDKKIKLMSPRSFHQNVAKRVLITERSTQQVTKKLLTEDSSISSPSNILIQEPTNKDFDTSKKLNKSLAVVQPLSSNGSSNSSVVTKVRVKRKRRQFNGNLAVSEVCSVASSSPITSPQKKSQ